MLQRLPQQQDVTYNLVLLFVQMDFHFAFTPVFDILSFNESSEPKKNEQSLFISI